MAYQFPIQASPITTYTPEQMYSALDGQQVTPSDTINLTIPFSRSIFIGGAGNLTVTTYNGTKLTLTGVLAGTFVPMSVVKIWATGTTATNIVALI